MDSFRHEALLYAGEDDFAEQTLGFIRDGLANDEPTLVVVNAAKIERLRDELGAHAESVYFADMAGVGLNPARIIPAWREFLSANLDRPLRGIGEPIWAERTPDELVECQRHESLLNVAFAGAASFWLLCPYDIEALDPAVIEEAHRSHPFVMRDGASCDCSSYRGLEAAGAPFDAPLPRPASEPAELRVGWGSLREVRKLVSSRATAAGLRPERAADVVLAVHEVAANSLRHGGGAGTLRIWEENGSLISEISDEGRIDDPLIGRIRPPLGQNGGRGIWIVNQLCDLVQLRTYEYGTVVRLHMARS